MKNNKLLIDKISVDKIVKQFGTPSYVYSYNLLRENILKFKKWIVAYDDSFNSFSALEFRIKLSECCYKSIVYIHIDNLKDSNFKSLGNLTLLKTDINFNY